MTTPELDWSEANRAHLAAEIARVKTLVSGTAQQEVDSSAPPAGESETLALEALVGAFGMSAFERDVLVLAAGVELDAELSATCAQAGSARGFATFGLALAKLPNAHWSAVTPVRPLRRYRLLELREGESVTTGRLSVDERVLHYLSGINYLDPRLRPLLRRQPPPLAAAGGHRGIADAVTAVLEQGTHPELSVELTGDDPAGQRDIAWLAADAVGLELHALRASDLPANLTEIDAFATLWRREAALLESALLVECDSAASAAHAARLADHRMGLVFFTTRDASTLLRSARRFVVNKPTPGEQKALWQVALGPSAASLNGALDTVATQFRLSADTIVRTSDAVRASLASDGTAGRTLWRACRSSTRTNLDDLAQRVEPKAGFDELVLPDTQKSTLRQIVAHVAQRLKVYETWGFSGKDSRGLGISVLFAGESGTGKTMAAEVLAGELGLDLYRIDLASTVSKYIGETEKNLRRVFDAAEEGGAILLFDEADALFGKRSEVKDSHDRYANIEVSYLLQRMEAYRGLAILTTNNKSSLDPAFQRRLRFVVAFPFPDRSQRERIWRNIFPAATPVRDLDHGKLAQLDVAGGSIRNIALDAAFHAAQAGEPVGMRHLLEAAYGEALKRERPFSDAEVRGWV